MHKGILAGRLLAARKRVLAAVETAVTVYAIGPKLADALYVAQREKQADVRMMLELEAIGPIVEALNQCLGEALAAQVLPATLEQAEGYLSQADILAIPGLTKTSKDAINAYFADLERDASAE